MSAMDHFTPLISVQLILSLFQFKVVKFDRVYEACSQAFIGQYGWKDNRKKIKIS